MHGQRIESDLHELNIRVCLPLHEMHFVRLIFQRLLGRNWFVLLAFAFVKMNVSIMFTAALKSLESIHVCEFHVFTLIFGASYLFVDTFFVL